MIQLKNLSISFDNKVVLRDICFELKSQQSVTVLGANGCGKSSLAKAIAGLIPYEGKVLYNGQNLADSTQKQWVQNIAYIPAKLETYDSNLSVEQFALMGRFAYKKGLAGYTKKDYEKVAQSLEYVGLSSLAKHSLQTLSSGQEQLLLIATALVQDSELIIFDEPTANLDPKNGVAFVKLFKKLQATHTLILITHDIALAQSVTNRVLFVEQEQGFMYEKDFFTKEILEKHYKTPFVEKNCLGIEYE